MSLLVEWNGTTYDVDLSEASTRELDLLEQRTGEKWHQLLTKLLRLDPVAIRATFWLTDQRADPALKYSDYDGPPPRVLIPSLAELDRIVTDLGKLINAGYGTSGSDGSPSEESDPESSTSSPAETSS